MKDWDDTTNVSNIQELPKGEDGPRSRAYLIVLAGSNVGEMFKLEALNVIGRGRAASVRLIDDGISRRHAKVEVEGDTVFVQDLGSRNGTYCNGKRIDRRPLRDGDKIQVGKTTILKFTYHDELDETFQRQMYHSALRDSLTQAYNKRYFQDRIESEFRFAQRHESPLALIMLDIDHFKRVNDAHGHLAGDTALAEMAMAIQQTIRNEDVFARWGGEEFAIICRATTENQAVALAERLRNVVEELDLRYDDVPVQITISLGVAAYPHPKIQTVRDMIEAADRAMYKAKQSGRNRAMPGSD